MTPTQFRAARHLGETKMSNHKKWLVILGTQNGSSVTVEVFATNKEDAEYRAAFKAEKMGESIACTIAARRN